MKPTHSIIPPFDAILNYLEGLRSNDNREWFAEHKTEYTALRKQFETIVQEIITQISRIDKTIEGVEAKDCIYRINRDIRFSKDKIPYATLLYDNTYPFNCFLTSILTMVYDNQ